MMRRRDTIVIGWRVRCGCPYRRYVTSGLWGTGAREEATLFATLAEARQAAKSIERVCRSGPRVVRVVRSPPRTRPASRGSRRATVDGPRRAVDDGSHARSRATPDRGMLSLIKLLQPIVDRFSNGRYL